MIMYARFIACVQVKRMPGKGPAGAIANQCENKYRYDDTLQHSMRKVTCVL